MASPWDSACEGIAAPHLYSQGKGFTADLSHLVASEVDEEEIWD